jgi:hypothetical protein
MLTIEYAKDPVYSNAENTTVVLTVKFEEFNEEMPFGATPWDTAPHGIILYQNVMAGVYGPIAPFVPPPEPIQPVAEGVQDL